MIALTLIIMLGTAQPPPSEPLPDLDELLGLPRQRAAGVPERPLDRELSDRVSTEPFEQAVDLMRRAAQRLDARDPGVETQRLQEETLRRLDQLIAQARRQRNRSQQPQQQQQQDQQQRQAGRQSSQQQTEAVSQGAGDRTPVGPARTDAALDPAVVAAGAAWGNLPEHVRQALVQGLSDRFSSLYQRLTEEYYKRLAEDPRRRP
jgi:TolA-binding protein